MEGRTTLLSVRPLSGPGWRGGATPARPRGRGRVGGRELGAGGSARAGGPAPQARKGAASCVSRAAHSPRLVRGSSTRRAQRTTTRWLHQHPGLPLSRPSARAGCRLVFSQAASAGSSPVLRYAPGETPLEVCVEGGAVRRRLAGRGRRMEMETRCDGGERRATHTQHRAETGQPSRPCSLIRNVQAQNWERDAD